MKIILFDGVCNLCNASVDFVLRYDKNNVFKFASQQSEVGQNLMKQKRLLQSQLGTIIFIDEDQVYTKSSAVFMIASYLKGFPKVLKLFSVFPKSITDFMYDGIAENRYRWFGKKNTCRLPSEEEKSKFL